MRRASFDPVMSRGVQARHGAELVGGVHVRERLVGHRHARARCRSAPNHRRASSRRSRARVGGRPHVGVVPLVGLDRGSLVVDVRGEAVGEHAHRSSRDPSGQLDRSLRRSLGKSCRFALCPPRLRRRPRRQQDDRVGVGAGHLAPERACPASRRMRHSPRGSSTSRRLRPQRRAATCPRVRDARTLRSCDSRARRAGARARASTNAYPSARVPRQRPAASCLSLLHCDLFGPPVVGLADG